MELNELKKLATEGRNPRSANIDKASPEEIVRIIGAEDKTVAESVEKAHGQIAKQIEAAAYACGATTFIISGAGSACLCLSEKPIADELGKAIAPLDNHWVAKALTIDKNGGTVIAEA